MPIVALIVIGAGVAYAVSRAMTPIYEAHGSVLVIAAPSQAAGAASLNLSATQATATAATLMTEQPLLQKVINALHLDETAGVLASNVSATPGTNTELIDVVVKDTSPIRAAQIGNAIMSTYVGEISTDNAQRIQQAGAALQSQIAQVQDQLSQAQRELAATKAGQDTSGIRATITADTALLNTLTANYSTFQLTQAQNLQTASIAAAASPPDAPASPKKALNTALGALLGLVVGLALAAVFEYLDQGLQTADDVQERLKVPCLGVVPRYRTTRPTGKSKDADRQRRTAEVASEAYRRLRTNVLFSVPDGDLKSVMLTSVHSGEGKTCTAANLAVALASSEERVLLIDADLRRPDQHRLFGKRLDNGLSEMILATRPNSVPSLNGVHQTPFDNLSLLTSGTIPPNPSELLASKRAHVLLDRLAGDHDLLVIDTPPAGVVTDSLSLAAQASATVLVIEAGHTNAAQAAAVIESLRSVGANVVGVVLNKARARSLAGYYYQYGSYGSAPSRQSGGGAPRSKDTRVLSPTDGEEQWTPAAERTAGEQSPQRETARPGRN